MTPTGPKPTKPAARPPRPVRLSSTDLANAKRLCRVYGKDLRYVLPQGVWYFFNGMYWQEDHKEMHVQWLASRMASWFEVESRKATSPAKKTAFLKAAERCAMARTIANTVKCLSIMREIQVESADLDLDPMTLNTVSGVVHLRTGRIEPHDRIAHITQLAPITVAPGGPDSAQLHCPQWLAFLNTIFGNDQDLIHYIQRCVGYSLTGLTSERVLFVLYGDGSNGKTTFLNVIRAALGTYACATQPDLLLQRNTGNQLFDVARLRGVRMVITTESARTAVLNEGMVKQMTGRDPITAARKFHDPFEFIPAFKIWLATNHKPEVDGDDIAIWNRIRLIPFGFTIPEAQQDRHIEAKLNAELPGILRWAIQGALKWQDIGHLDTPAAVSTATREYRDDMDDVGAFLKEKTCPVSEHVGAKIQSSTLYAVYKTWRSEAGLPPVSQRFFSLSLKKRGVASRRTPKCVYFNGLRLIDEAKSWYEEPEI